MRPWPRMSWYYTERRRERKKKYIYIRKKEGGERRRSNRTEGKREWKGNEGETVRGYASPVKSSRTKSTNKSWEQKSLEKWNLSYICWFKFPFFFFRYREYTREIVQLAERIIKSIRDMIKGLLGTIWK